VNEREQVNILKHQIATFMFIGDFPQKSPIISSSFAERDVQERERMRRCVWSTHTQTHTFSKVSFIIIIHYV